MLRNIFLLSLLVHAVCSTHWEVREVDSAEDELEEIPDYGTANEKALSICSICQKILNSVKKKVSCNTTPDHGTANEKAFSICSICQKILNSVKKKVSRNTTPDSIKGKLIEGCNKLFIGKTLCKKFVTAHLHTLVDELMTDDGPRTICAKAGACKKPPAIKEFIFVDEQVNNHL
ncbi:hypothetical protein DNTS_003517 [Danionella cerebrum]|uniref:Saposin B-type domain-containing protein n=1 Tax=Danionella cerebrum TaxID=2873325 RepID=A0A553MTW6_9TELE|nr:hypothetical protein DNTS_003517 [Danionella translucida]